MGFYSPAVLIKDAQRHGLRVRPIDVQHSQPLCTIEVETDSTFSLRLGFNYAKGLQSAVANALVNARALAGNFHSIDDLALRVPELNRKDLVSLAKIGALNSIGEVEHRRDALWQVEEAARTVGPLLRGNRNAQDETRKLTPLRKMNDEERLAADFSGTGFTTGPHPMAYYRAALRSDGILSAEELTHCLNRQRVSIAGCVIARQRPGTAKGFVFLSLEDETGIANIVIAPDVFEANRIVVTRSRILRIDGQLQLQDGVIHVKAWEIVPLDISKAEVRSHDFY
jgi:error-prone DNA polymerase